MDTAMQVVSWIVMALVAIFLPFVAYGFAYVLNSARYAVDCKLEWENDGDGNKEKVEDVATYTSVVVFTIASLVIFGALYVLWFQKYVSSAFGLPESKVLPTVYWTAVYAVTFIMGWYRCNNNRKNLSENK